MDALFSRQDFTREQILSAALRCYQKWPIEDVRLSDIAIEANVSRATVYRYFNNKQEILIAIVLKTLHGFLDEIEEKFKSVESFAEYTVETIAMVFANIQEIPFFATISNALSFAVAATEDFKADIFEIMNRHFRVRFEAARLAGDVRRELEFEEFIGWVFHVVLSYTILPTPNYNPACFRGMLWQFFIPSIVR